MSRAWLKAKRASYFEDARRLAAMGSEDIGGLTGEQWGVVYRAVADELGKCADEAPTWLDDAREDHTRALAELQRRRA